MTLLMIRVSKCPPIQVMYITYLAYTPPAIRTIRPPHSHTNYCYTHPRAVSERRSLQKARHSSSAAARQVAHPSASHDSDPCCTAANPRASHPGPAYLSYAPVCTVHPHTPRGSLASLAPSVRFFRLAASTSVACYHRSGPSSHSPRSKCRVIL